MYMIYNHVHFKRIN